MSWPTTNSRKATVSHSRDAVASSMVMQAVSPFVFKWYRKISTSMGSFSPTKASRTQIRFSLVSIESSVIVPMEFSRLFIATRAVKAKAVSLER